MTFAVIDGGYEEYMRRLSAEADKGMMEILGYIPDCSRPKGVRLAYLFALYDQRREKAKRRCEISRRGDCVVLRPAAFKKIKHDVQSMESTLPTKCPPDPD